MSPARLRERLRGLWRQAKSPLLIVAVLVLIVAAIGSVVGWRGAVDVNRTIVALRGGQDIPIEVDARPELLLARIAYLAAHDELDRGRIFLEALDRSGSDDIRARGHYLLANALLRKAFEIIESAELDAANPFVNLAKRDYRRALQLRPDFWDAKHNLDVASRLIRDFPDYERQNGDELSADPKKLWTDIPGKPKGLP
jgi:mxaK protein